MWLFDQFSVQLGTRRTKMYQERIQKVADMSNLVLIRPTLGNKGRKITIFLLTYNLYHILVKTFKDHYLFLLLFILNYDYNPACPPDDLCVGEEAGHLPCFHKFHMPCITRWMMRSNTCPLCRTRVPLRHTAGIPWTSPAYHNTMASIPLVYVDQHTIRSFGQKIFNVCCAYDHLRYITSFLWYKFLNFWNYHLYHP